MGTLLTRPATDFFDIVLNNGKLEWKCDRKDSGVKFIKSDKVKLVKEKNHEELYKKSRFF